MPYPIKGECRNTGRTRFKKGFKPSEETKRKIRLANKGKKLSEETKRKLSLAKKGTKHPNWKGGKYIGIRGYIHILRPNHPFSDYQGYIREHRLVIEKQIGRYLKPEEVGHHIGKIDDNRPHMLMAFVNQSTHIRFHRTPHSVKPEEIVFDGRKL